jgi:hypothetical protein
MNDNVKLRDGVLDEAKYNVNSRTNGLVKIVVDVVFDYLEAKIKNLPETIKRLRNNPETEKKIEALWSEHLFEEGLVPKGYNGLPDNLLIHNFRQEGYLDGLYVGYILAMMALVDNNAPEEIVLAARDSIRPNLMGHRYDKKDEFVDRYKNDKYSWVDKSKDA